VTPADRPRAADIAAFFDGARLTLARQLAGLRKSDLAQLLDMSPTAVAAWESGAKRPTAVNVARLALSLGVDPGFFAMRPDDVAALSATPHFRSLRSTTQLARDQAFAYGQLAVDIATSLEKHVECPDPDVPSFPVPIDTDDLAADGPRIGAPERAARHVRDRWRMHKGPAPHLVRLLENHGVLVVFSPPQAASVDAYSFDSRLRPVVVLNPVKHDYYRQRFDVAHELGHLVMHTDAEPGGRTVEDQANRFAAEFLMPAAEVGDELPKTVNAAAWQSLARCKERWGTSIQALLYRARRLGAFSEVSYRNAMATLTSRGWRRSEPGLVTVLEQPSLLPRALELLAAEGISEHDLRDQCRVPAELFRTVTSRHPQPVPPNVALPDAATPGAALPDAVPPGAATPDAALPDAATPCAVPHDTHAWPVTSLFR
jgi:Zn-dependent peptidase ImmA (M78 family)/transcriptional regulator with XRE-family HTH domain